MGDWETFAREPDLRLLVSLLRNVPGTHSVNGPRRFDASGFIVEHYSDGDLVNKDVPAVRNAAAKNTLAVWGPNVPLGFNNASIKYEPRLVAAPDVVQSIPAQVEVRA